MNKKIDFKKVAEDVRFEMLGTISLPTPSDFQMLSDEDMQRLYERIFHLHHDVCCYLQSSIDLDELSVKYDKINYSVESGEES